MNTNILFTSVGRRVELLDSFRRAYEELGVAGRIVATDVEALAPALSLADRPYIVPRLDHPDYISTLADIICREQVSVVFPLIDPDIPVLAEHRTVLEATGAKLAVVPQEAAAVAADKWKTNEFFSDLGLTVPRSWLPGTLDPAEAEYPLFIKPRFGSASEGAFKVETSKQLEFFSDYVPDAIIQEYLPGPEITNDVICHTDGRLLAVVSRQRIRVRSGEVIVGKTVFDPTITDACERIAAALPAIGPITVQCMMNGGVPTFTEINARLGGGVPLGIAAGADSPRWLLARAAGIEVEIPPPGSYCQNMYISRFDQSHFITEAKCNEFASRCL